MVQIITFDSASFNITIQIIVIGCGVDITNFHEDIVIRSFPLGRKTYDNYALII